MWAWTDREPKDEEDSIKKTEKSIIYKLSLNVEEIELLKNVFGQIEVTGFWNEQIRDDAERFYNKICLEFADQEWTSRKTNR